MPVGGETHESSVLRTLLRADRIEGNLTQAELARKLGMPQSTISKLEAGERHLTVLELHAICAALDIRSSDFVARFEELLDARGNK